METFLKIIHVFASVFLILVVLLQSGRGGGMGAAFGGASNQIFGGRGASSFLTRVTSAAAIVFFCTSLTLSMMSSRHRSVVLKSGMLPAQGRHKDAAATQTDGNTTSQDAPAQTAAPSSGDTQADLSPEATAPPAGESGSAPAKGPPSKP